MTFILLLQEATAYFSLISLFSGICGTAISKKLAKTIGQKVCIPSSDSIENKTDEKSIGLKCEVTFTQMLLVESSVGLHQVFSTLIMFSTELRTSF